MLAREPPIMTAILPQSPRHLTPGKVLTYAVLALWTLFCLFPLYWVFITSLKDSPAIEGGPAYIPFGDFVPTGAAWLFILTDPSSNLVMRAVNSGVVALVSTLLTLILGSLCVYGATRFRKPGFNGGRLLVAIMATRLLPPAAVALPIYMLARMTGTLDTRLALIVTYTAVNLPVAVWLLRPVFGSSATEQEDAAQLDGASRLMIFLTIAVPMAATGIAACAFLVFILCWNEYLFAAYLTADQALTLPPWAVGQLSLKEAQIGGEAVEWAHLSAATLLAMMPALFLSALVQTWLARSISVR